MSKKSTNFVDAEAVVEPVVGSVVEAVVEPVVTEKPKEEFKFPKFKNRKRKGNARVLSSLTKDIDKELLEEPDYSAKEYKAHGVCSIEKAKLIKKKRIRQNGLSHQTMAISDAEKAAEEQKYKEQAWKDKGGLMSSDHAMMFLEGDGEVNLRHLNSTFAKETKRTDHERAMKEFIDKEVARRKGYLEEYEKRQEDTSLYSLKALEDKKLYVMEERYESIPKTFTPRNQGEIGHNILEGIPEIHLGTENRIDNIEKTMKTVQKLHEIDEISRKKVTIVPSNYTSNYLLHNKYMGEIFERSDTNRYMELKTDLGMYAEASYDVCNDGMRR